MVRILVFLLIFGIGSVSAQKDNRAGMTQLGASLSPGFMRDNVRNIYIHGFIRHYPENIVSLRGDGYYYVSSLGDYKPIRQNHQTYAGGFIHLKSPGVDTYFGFQPGLAFSAREDSIVDLAGYQQASSTSINPLTSFVFGFNYFGSKHFSLFIETRFTRGIHLSNSWPKYLDELRLSFGLAFQFGGN